MSGVPEDRREAIKTAVVHYLESNADAIRVGILVVDASSAVEIIDRHLEDDTLPHDIELFQFLQDLDLPPVVAANKMDKVDNRDATLNALCDRLGLHPPWQQWQDTVAPITAKRGNIDALETAVRTHFKTQKRHDLLQFF